MLYIQVLVLSFTAKILIFLSKTFKIGAGTSISGLLVEKYFARTLKYFNKKYKKIIYISGTNGKTTTTTTLFQILKTAGLKVNSNIGGANIFRGIAGQILRDFKILGGVKNEILLIECEEATLPKLTNLLPPTHLVLLNIFRDQLDVYAELDVTLKYFKDAIKNSKNAKIIINGDDNFLMQSINNTDNKTIIYSVKNNEKPLYENDTLNPQEKDYYIQKSNSGFEILKNSKNQQNKIEINFNSTDYNLYNYGAAILTAQDIGISLQDIAKSFDNMKAAFGRGEKIQFGENTIELYLIKNPAGAYATIQDILKNDKNKSFELVFGINDKIADGKDVSWIYDIPLENISNWHKVDKISVIGSRKLDMALRLKHAGLGKKLDLDNTLDTYLLNIENKSFNNQNIKFLLTYTTLREVRDKISRRVQLKAIDEI